MTAERDPLVTVIVPVFNGERYLRESLDSILNQTYTPIEVIVMDDASTDRTADIVQSYGNAVRHVRQPQNRGIYGNANDGIALSRGAYIAVYHADDVYDPKIVEREVAFLENHGEAGAVFSSMEMIWPSGAERGIMTLPPRVRGERPLPFEVVFNTLLLYKNCFLMCPGAMVRASAYRDVGVYRDREFRNTADLEMWLRIAAKHPIGVLEQKLFKYRFGHGNSAQRYHRLRTDPERYFAIMDRYLADGASRIASPEALCAHEAHRSEDAVMRAISAYVLGDRRLSRRILGEARLRALVGSGSIQRTRMVLVFAALQLFVRVPRVAPVARAMAWRWDPARPKRRRPRFRLSPA